MKTLIWHMLNLNVQVINYRKVIKWLSIFVLMATTSCSFLVRQYFGIPNEIEIHKPYKEIIAFYNDFATNPGVAIYVFEDSIKLSNFDSTIKKYPKVFLQNRQTNSILSLNCLEDIAYDVDKINNNDYYNLLVSDTSQFYFIQSKVSADNFLCSIFENKNNKMGEWDIYFVFSSSMGQRYINRFNALMEIDSFHNFSIINLSIKN